MEQVVTLHCFLNSHDPSGTTYPKISSPLLSQEKPHLKSLVSREPTFKKKIDD
jgi:hypothetical protein